MFLDGQFVLALAVPAVAGDKTSGATVPDRVTAIRAEWMAAQRGHQVPGPFSARRSGRGSTPGHQSSSALSSALSCPPGQRHGGFDDLRVPGRAKRTATPRPPTSPATIFACSRRRIRRHHPGLAFRVALTSAIQR